MNSPPGPLDIPVKNGVTDEKEPEPHFEPIVTLPEVKIPTLEEDEAILIKQRAKLFRLDKVSKEWKERGTGDAKLLHHEKNGTVRVVMRRDQTLKLCANHYVTPYMELNAHKNSNRTWIWTTMADYSDGCANSEILAIRFINAETAKRWKDKFDEAKDIVSKNKMYDQPQDHGDSDDEVSSSDEESDISDYKDAEEESNTSKVEAARGKNDCETNQKEEVDTKVHEITDEVGKLQVKTECESDIRDVES